MVRECLFDIPTRFPSQDKENNPGQENRKRGPETEAGCPS